MNNIKIIKGGFLTTIQDKGRWGYQKFGMPVAGAMDDFSMRVANILVDNDEYSAVLESTLLGPTIEFLCEDIIGITGANMNPQINGKPVLMWTSIFVSKGDILSFKGATSGLRTYISSSKGFQVPLVNNSKSTYVKSGIGGYKGRKLLDGDMVPLGNRILSQYGSYINPKDIPQFKKEANIRVVMGPQDDYFPQDSIETFLNNPYKITTESDRMGYRLEGLAIKHKKSPDIISDGIVFGSIQVPGQGQPIILMADRQTAGGYTKIGTVISPDLPTLAQMGPGSLIYFKKVEIDEAHRIYREYEEKIKDIRTNITQTKFKFKDIRNLNLNINNNLFQVEIREI